jgi:hypothetical protein
MNLERPPHLRRLAARLPAALFGLLLLFALASTAEARGGRGSPGRGLGGLGETPKVPH